ncbi:MAG: gamma-glutamyltransferase family protein [Rhizobiaceae bacterium]
MRNLQLPGRSPVIAENAMAATAHPLATSSALAVLKEGGNAVDAALAASAVLCVVEPAMTGIGGDCFVILSEPDGTIHGLNGSGRAPADADAAWYRDNGFAAMPQTGAHSVTVPGAAKAWEALHERFGTLSLERLFRDAIAYARDGFAVHHRVALDWSRAAGDLAKDAGGAANCLVDGRAPAAGTRFRFPALGDTLARFAAEGSRAIYDDEIAEEIAATIQAQGGFLEEADLARVSADWIEPISTRYGDIDVLEIPPSGQGIIALVMLNLMRQTGFGALDANGADRLHMQIEIARAAFAVRDALVADPMQMTATTAQILCDDFTAALARGIDPDKRNADLMLPPLPDSDTTYLTVVDRDRMAVSFINSLYSGFGSKVVTPKSGIALQNRGGCFTLEEGHPNELKPGKRPMHTIIPAMAMKGGRPWMPFGVMGGSYQPLGHALVISNIVDHGMDPQQAIDHPRLFWNDDGIVNAEAGIPAACRTELGRRGHEVRDADMPIGGGQAIMIDEENGFLVAGSDPRKDGHAGGW